MHRFNITEAVNLSRRTRLRKDLRHFPVLEQVIQNRHDDLDSAVAPKVPVWLDLDSGGRFYLWVARTPKAGCTESMITPTPPQQHHLWLRSMLLLY